ncbi:3-hydroxyacyl-CoA dehydrogenase NAD-binding domain-containing protein [Phytohabitans sp. ZYX-F-186]|uniref:3-hydroxyacyl-CoA dehydrogenase NAD-binding domain-containing protein n=1 Tax=Phytohabitans maris TaxID=3071409 RepID=A0ABU0ZDK6_9ACTN|nr:3-hydroxyacyl-CoA dehydrogenase NAD-binding domain-containing protein [Phytohabitans sp. ZYX-F-186]MDQ7905141.1 3-hydroxyacyl-CoA dehydrogenase NAD-binding domain-containing protein [Phytohabitans sp. ZYX-F-186]
MPDATQRTATIIGAGTIGLGWTTLFLAHGLRVRVNSRRADAERIVRDGLALFAPTLPGGAADPAELATRLEVQPDLKRAVDGADVVQENAPEDLDLKRQIFAQVVEAAPEHTLLLSSTSSLLPDDLGADLRDPARVVVGHPFNPPHVIPLVEVVASERADAALVRRAEDFYRAVGKAPIVLARSVPGFVANRLQSALLRESIHLVRSGVVTVAQLDAVVVNSIGLRWATVGPFQAFHLGGGPGGLRHWLAHLGVGLEAGWRGLGEPPMDETTVRTLVDQADDAFAGRTYPELVADRDARQLAVLRALAGS